MALTDAVRVEREQQNQRFATLFANWCSTGSHDESVIPVEAILARVVALATMQIWLT